MPLMNTQKIMAHKVYIHDGGGGGDIPANQFQLKKGWGFLESFKKKFPNSKIRAIVTSCSKEGARYLKYNPHIDEIKELPWVNPHRPWKDLASHVTGHIPLDQAVKKFMPEIKGKGKIPPVYLSPEDKVFVKGIIDAGKYTFIHPFAGTPERMAFPLKEYPKLIDRLIDELGYNVVLIGATYKQLANQGMKEKIKKEEFEYQRPGFFNIVNKANMRIGVYLAQYAERWIGTWSCYVWPGFVKKQRMTLLMPKETYCGAGVRDKNQQIIIRIPKQTKDFSQFIDKTIKHLS